MNGLEHYKEADRLLKNAQRELEKATPNTVDQVHAVVALAVAKAQVHALLALVKVTLEKP